MSADLRTALSRLLRAAKRANNLSRRQVGCDVVGARVIEAAAKALEAQTRTERGLPEPRPAPPMPPVLPAKTIPTSCMGGHEMGRTNAPPRPLWLQDTPAGAVERDRLEWAFIARTLAECRKRVESDGSRQSWLDPAENIARERARRFAERCPLCTYQHGHAIGCDNNPVDIALGQGKETTT